MIDIKLIRENPEQVSDSIARRGMNAAQVDVEGLRALDERWRKVEAACDELRSERNQLSAQIKKLSAKEREEAIAQVKQAKEKLTALEAESAELNAQREEKLRLLPNLLGEDVPPGKTDDDNVEVASWGERPSLGFEPRDHLELGALTDTIDFERAGKTVGHGFYYLKNEAALLETALYGYAADAARKAGYVPISTPDLARDSIIEGIGFAPRGPETQIYSIADSDLSLVATAEITIGGYHAGEILDTATLPRRYLGLSHCFRTEAGAHGKESRGLYRVHQFSKAELFILCAPEQSQALHDEIRALEEELLQGLQIPYRVMNVCAGELGAPAAKKYDIEAWMPGRDLYGEVTSCSNCTDFQARRLNIRYRPEAKASPQFVHMLNGTAIAVSRALIAIYENYQQQDGSIQIPGALRRWLPDIDAIPVRR